jgi:hypothetical protein
MRRDHFLQRTEKRLGPSRREWLGGAMVAVAAGVLWVGGATSAIAAPVPQARIWIGAAAADITPDRSVPLTGYQAVRVSRGILSRCTANVLALESRQGDLVLDQAILVSCDLCVIRPGIQEAFRKHVAGRLPRFDINKLFLAATHTHTAPEILQERYDEKDYGDAMQPKEYVPFMYERMAQAVVQAWESRAAGGVAWGLGHAVVGHNRRAVYADGSGRMYGNANDPQFRGIEGYEDHAVAVLCCYDSQQRLNAAAIALACPSQSVGGDKLSADFWHDVRRLLQERHGEQLHVLGFCAPAGDQAPNLLYRKSAEGRMEQLRGLTQTQELGRRIADAFDDVAQVVAKDIRTEAPLVHVVRQIDLPARLISDAEYTKSKAQCVLIDAKPVRDKTDAWYRHFHGLVVERFEAQQKAAPMFSMELHVLRLGDLAIATNPFELYLDYGVQIQARSPAPQTMLIQLATSGRQHAYYLPTPRAVSAGGYSAEATHNIVGPEGGQALVDRTVQEINGLWSLPAAKP